MDQSINLEGLWAEIREKVFEKTFSTSLARAFERAVPIVIEESVLVIGFAPLDKQYRGHLETFEVKNLIQEALREKFGRTFTFEIIEGTSLETWESIKERRAVAGVAEEEKAARLRREEVYAQREQVWNNLLEELYTEHSKTPGRRLPQVRAQFLLEALKKVAETEKNLAPGNPQEDEVNQRWLAKIFERLGSFVEVSPVVVALEFQRCKSSKAQ